MKIWFPEFYTEAHRETWQGAMLVAELGKIGICCEFNYQEDCQAVFVGGYLRCARYLAEREKIPGFNLPEFFYNWDLYPWQIELAEKGDDFWAHSWRQYVRELRRCHEILVPSACTAERTCEIVQRESHRILSSVRTFDEPVWEGGYVLNCMRQYPDPNKDLVYHCCKQIGLPCVETHNKLPWEEYKRVVAGCRFMVSAQFEASTGGLSLLEGFALGKPVLLSNSPYHGGVDYFGSYASYFQWDDRESLKGNLRQLWKITNPANRSAPLQHSLHQVRKEWVETTYSEQRFARDLAARFRTILPS